MLFRSGRVPGADSLQFRDVHAVSATTAWLLSIGNGPQSRIYRTTNGGQSWSVQFTNRDPKGFYDCLDFWDAQRGVVIGDAIDTAVAILTTVDGGAHWDRVSAAALPAAQPTEGSFAASGTCLVSRPGGHAWIVASTAAFGRVLHTHDHGRSWRVDTLPLTTRAGAGPQSVAFVDERHGMALGGGTTAAAGDVQSAVTSDGGRTWTARAKPPLASGVWGGAYVPGAEIGRAHV